jgi:hypothetical protein
VPIIAVEVEDGRVPSFTALDRSWKLEPQTTLGQEVALNRSGTGLTFQLGTKAISCSSVGGMQPRGEVKGMYLINFSNAKSSQIGLRNTCNVSTTALSRAMVTPRDGKFRRVKSLSQVATWKLTLPTHTSSAPC